MDISDFKRLIYFLKKKSKGYVPKKSEVLTGNQVLTFLKNSPNEVHLLHKVKEIYIYVTLFHENTLLQVILIMGVFGALRKIELVQLTVDNVEDRGSFILMKIPQTKTDEAKSFTIVEDEVGALALAIVRKYAELRPAHVTEKRLFLSYRDDDCTAQPVEKNTIGSIPSIVARYLNLDNPKQYSDHCLRL